MTLVSIFDPRVKAIEITENNEPLVDVADIKKVILSEEWAENYPSFRLVRQSVYDSLQNIADDLPEDIYLFFIEGHRPLTIQEQLFSQYSNKLKGNNPDWDEDRIFNEAAKLVAPPTKVPPHLTGSAVDVVLCDKNGNLLDMGSPVDDDPNLNEGRNNLDAINISEKAQENRQFYGGLMKKHGFVNYDYEYWHWSKGDQYWAFKKGKDHAIYDVINAESHPIYREPVMKAYYS